MKNAHVKKLEELFHENTDENTLENYFIFICRLQNRESALDRPLVPILFFSFFLILDSFKKMSLFQAIYSRKRIEPLRRIAKENSTLKVNFPHCISS